MSAHGLMHTVIANAHAGDPYKIDTLFMYMANMAWNSSMNPGEASRMLADKDPATGAIASRMSSIPTRSSRRPSPMPTGAARHHLSGALGLHFAAGSADRQPGGAG